MRRWKVFGAIAYPEGGYAYDHARPEYVEVIEAAPMEAKVKELEAEIERLKSLISWLRDGIQHFDDEGQVAHLTKAIDAILEGK